MAQSGKTVINERQSFTELRVMCGVTGEQGKPTRHLRGLSRFAGTGHGRSRVIDENLLAVY
jgi:hypothetical protein